MHLDLLHKRLDLARPVVMGVLNVTPDSFSDGGRYAATDAAVQRALALAGEGAAIIDVGGESTRPGAAAVGAQEEMDRVLPVIEAVASRVDLPISIDTSKAEVMLAAIEAGASMINDVQALAGESALAAAAGLGVPVCLMHMQGQPRTMQDDPRYGDVVAEVLAFLEARVAACEAAGIPRRQIVVDPGFGFGKTVEHNLRLMHDLGRFRETGCPVLVGVSRKSMIGAVLDRPVDDRLPGGLALAALAVREGAAIIRTHDVAATLDAVTMAAAVRDVG